MKDFQIQSLQNQLNTHSEHIYVLAISGGVDSMVLWNLFEHAQKNYVVAHVHHHQRPEADDEYRMIEARCQMLNIPFYGTHLTFEHMRNFQANARAARLSFFLDVAQKVNSNTVVLAHHFDDQIETLMMRMLKGTSWQTWEGMKTRQQYANRTLYRPLLSITKKDLYAYAETQKLTFYEDVSNKSLSYQRNRIRHQTLPSLMQRNPQIISQLDTLRTLVKRFNQCFNDHVSVSLSSTLKHSTLLAYPASYQQHFFFNWLKHWSKKPRSHLQVKSWLNAITHQKEPLYIPLSKDRTLCSAYGNIWIESIKEPPKYISISNFGEYRIEAHYGVLVSKEKNLSQPSQTWELCYNEATFPIILRHRKKGDVILMSYGHKKVKNLLIDLKIPQPQRSQLWLIESQGDVYGILGLPIQRDCRTCAKKIYLTEVSYAQS